MAPNIFDDLDISYDDLSFFRETNADGIRLDVGFTGLEESIMTYNPQELKIEINMSQNIHYLDTIMDYRPNKEKLIGCHNFYPHRYSGLGINHFLDSTQRFNKYGLKTAAFVTSQNKCTFGPWPVTDGLLTLEMHRNLPIDVQVKHFIELDNINDIIISNCYPTDEEIQSIGNMRKDLVEFDIKLVDGVSEVEKKILFDELHFKVYNTPDILKRGDIVIESSEYGSYAGELQIVLKDMKNSGKSNVVGGIREEEIFIIDYIKPWQKFKFKEIK